MPASRTLILMRHAEAGAAHNDHDRPLTPAGRADAAAAGEWIRQALPEVAEVVCSTALRTRQTLAASGVDAPTRFAEELYGGGIEDILTQIAATSDTASTVLVVGHAPGIPATAHELLTVASLVRADDRLSSKTTNGAPADGDPADSGADGDPARGDHLGNGSNAAVDDLRHFSASAIAVLTTEASWAELADYGAELQTVRHPSR